MDGLNQLERMVIGKSCFGTGNDDGLYRVASCPKLNTIEIGDYSFSNFVSFELRNLPSLRSIGMGRNCFYYAPSFSLVG